jgi:O-methyltransferase/aklanonic acid methyltransferase
MEPIWSRPIGKEDLDYWEYFGLQLVERAVIQPGAIVLDVGCGTGSSLFPAAEAVGEEGHVLGVDICPG